jgi:hypothetical protein
MMFSGGTAKSQYIHFTQALGSVKMATAGVRNPDEHSSATPVPRRIVKAGGSPTSCAELTDDAWVGQAIPAQLAQRRHGYRPGSVRAGIC